MTFSRIKHLRSKNLLKISERFPIVINLTLSNDWFEEGSQHPCWICNDQGLEIRKNNSVNLLYLHFSKVNGYFEKTDKNKYLTLVPTNESKEMIEKSEELWSKIRNLIRPITKNSDDYDEKCRKIKLDSDGDLSLNKTIEIQNVTIVVRAISYENKEYYLQVFLDEGLYKL